LGLAHTYDIRGVWEAETANTELVIPTTLSEKAYVGSADI